MACIIIPFIASFYPKHAFYKYWKFFFKANIIVALIFIIWDYFFTKAGIWGFNYNYLIGLEIGNLPIEEILFFFCIPYACVFTYFALKHLIQNNPISNIESFITYIIIAVLFCIAIMNYDKLYTSITLFSMIIYLIYLKVKRVDLSYHYLSFLATLPFFYISNGILTGSFLVDPIVWYNDMENLNFRINNIPFEDVFYGMLLIFLNIELFEYFKKLSKETTH